MNLFKTIISQINTIIADLKKINEHIEAPQESKNETFNSADWIPRSKVAQLLCVSERTIQRYTANGDIVCVRIGSQTFYNVKELFSYDRSKRGKDSSSDPDEKEEK